MEHISDHDLERYYLGIVTDEAELAPLEEHLLWCHRCLDRIELVQAGVDMIRVALLRAGDPEGSDARQRRRGKGREFGASGLR